MSKPTKDYDRDRFYLLPALGILFPKSPEFKVFDLGYLETSEFQERAHGANPYAVHPLGAFESKQTKSGTKLVCYMLDVAIRSKFPLNVFVRGHEETEILQPQVLDRMDLLEKRLYDCSINPLFLNSLRRDNLPEEIPDAGGVFALYSVGVRIGEQEDPNWQRLLTELPTRRERDSMNLQNYFYGLRRIFNNLFKPPELRNNMGKKKIGLALGGGGARGLAHIGVLKVLEENNIHIDYISGTSMGAIIGAMYSSQPNIKKIEKEVLELDWKSLFDYSIPTRGLIKGEKIEKFLREKLGNLEFKDLKIPLLITAFDLLEKREVVFSKGDLVKAIRASISIPGFFVPVTNNGRILVDGGLVDSIPTEILDKKTDIILAVNVNKRRKRAPIMDEEAVRGRDPKDEKNIPGIMECAARSLQIMGSGISDADLTGDEIDLLININLEEVGVLDFKDISSIIARGEVETRKVLKKIKSLSKSNPFREFFAGLKRGLGGSIVNSEGITKDITNLSSV